MYVEPWLPWLSGGFVQFGRTDRVSLSRWRNVIKLTVFHAKQLLATRALLLVVRSYQ